MVDRHERDLCSLKNEVNHESKTRPKLIATAQRNCADREDKRAHYALVQMEYEREALLLIDKLELARRNIAAVNNNLERLVRYHKNLLGIIYRAGYPCSRP